MASAQAAAKTVVIVGSGGREHALAWKLAQSPRVARLIVAPGNAGMPLAWERWAFSGKKGADFEAFSSRAREEGVDLVVVGPDNPLADGLVDVLSAHGVLAFGPTAGAARIEASKAFAKEVMQAAGVPTARHWVAKTAEEARKILKSIPWGNGWVVKADGLALGKGVRVCATQTEAIAAAEELLKLALSPASPSPSISPAALVPLVIEEKLRGEEISWMAFCDGERCVLLDPARDYKRVGDGDAGLNTGGMGAFSPVRVPAGFAERVKAEVFLPTLREMKKRGIPFRGVLYAGLMVDFEADRYWVLEFNARFGDPETQVLMPRIEGDLFDWLEASARGELNAMPTTVPFCKNAAVFVVGAARGYPERPEKGMKIQGAPDPTQGGIFYAGVERDASGALTVSGGRVLGALGLGDSLENARAQAYEKLTQVSFTGMHFRSDIAGGSR
jgi:phosphoribosylamine--glycine ligase